MDSLGTTRPSVNGKSHARQYIQSPQRLQYGQRLLIAAKKSTSFALMGRPTSRMTRHREEESVFGLTPKMSAPKLRDQCAEVGLFESAVDTKTPKQPIFFS